MQLVQLQWQRWVGSMSHPFLATHTGQARHARLTAEPVNTSNVTAHAPLVFHSERAHSIKNRKAGNSYVSKHGEPHCRDANKRQR